MLSIIYMRCVSLKIAEFELDLYFHFRVNIMEDKFSHKSKKLKTNDLAWNNFEQSLETLLRDRRHPDPSAGFSTETPPPPSPCSTLSDQLPSSSPSNLHGDDLVPPRPIPTITTVSTMNLSMLLHNQNTTPAPSYPSLGTPLRCEMCPSPSPFTAKTRDSMQIHLASHQHVKFVCAACGQSIVDYEEMVKHVETEHVGDDQELVRASIVIPDNIHLLKMFQCGIKTCARKLIGMTELDLKEHIRRNHGEFYIHMGQGRNLVRMCRLCPSVKFVSDQSLTEHIQQSHPQGLYANGESRDILPTQSASSQAEHAQGHVAGGEVGRGERLDVWYFRDQNQNMVEERRDGVVMNLSSSRKENSIHSSKLLERELTRENYEREEFKGRDVDVRKKRSRKQIKEDESFSISPLELIEERRPIDLKYKLKNVRENKKADLVKVFCHACCSTTLDWKHHKFSLKHIQNDKKARCLFCPKRVWFSKLKSHVQTDHKGCSFSCNVASSCLVRLMDLGKLTDHINSKHRDQVDKLWKGQYWESEFVSSNYLGKSNFFLLPSDLRKLSCKLCGLVYLGQDQAALSQHFQLQHPDLSSRKYRETILYECRACDGMLFGSEDYLLDHFTQAHAEAGLSIHRESEEEVRARYKFRKTPVCRGKDYYEESRRQEYFAEVHTRENNSRKEAIVSHGGLRHSEDRDSRKRAISTARYGDEDGKEKHTIRRKRRCSESSSRFYKTEDYSPYYDRKGDQNPYAHKKRLHLEVAPPSVRQGFDDYDSQATEEDCVVTCPFCDKKILQSRLRGHMKKKHKDNLFSCDGSCDKKFKSAWRSEVVTHLKMVHKLAMSDSILFRHYLSHPVNKAMICCKVSECEEAIFLCRSVAEAEKLMTRHVGKYHKGQLTSDWFNLGCRCCSSVFKTNEEAEWEKHLSLDHTRMPKIRPRTVSTSKIEFGRSGPCSDNEDSTDVVAHKNEERLVRLLSRPASPVRKIEVNLDVCKFCGERVEEEKKAGHEKARHLAQLFSCKDCQEDGNSWVGQTASELVSHVAVVHNTDLMFEVISAPGDQDITLSICTVCQAQFYTRDPSILATHLLDHELGPDMKRFTQCCRICFSMKEGSMTPVKSPGQHYEEVHSRSYASTHDITVKEEEDEIPSVTKAILKMHEEAASKTLLDEDSLPCPYYGDELDIKDDISTTHFQKRFHCTICENNKNTPCIPMFDELDKAMEHMATVHQLEMLPAMIAQARAASSPSTLCPVISTLGLHSSALKLPSTASQLIQVQCQTCLTTALQISSEKFLKHGDDCTRKQLVLQCRLCQVSLPDSGSTDVSTYCSHLVSE